MSATEGGGHDVVCGGGMLGAAVAAGLARQGRRVTLIEAAPTLGGLASAWTIDTTDGDTPGDTADGGTARGPVTWDRFYHVVLSADRRVIDLLDSLGMRDRLHLQTVKSELLAGGKVRPMSSVIDLLTLDALSPIDRLRVGATVGLGAVLPVGWGENTTSAAWLRRWSGASATGDLWMPLLRAKLGEQAEAASGRFIRSTFRRLLTARLKGGDGDLFGWVEGGYHAVLGAVADNLRSLGVEVRTGTAVQGLERSGSGWTVQVAGTGTARTGTGADPNGRSEFEAIPADRVVVTTPGPIAARLLGEHVPSGWLDRLNAVSYLGCVCVSVVLRRQLTGGYLTYVTDDTPYTAVVEMTNLIDPEQLGGRHLVYLPRYTGPDDELFSADENQIAERFVDDLIRRYPQLTREDVLAAKVARARHVMPVPVPGSALKAPPMRTGVPGLYLASSAQITDGTLNVESTLALAERLLDQVRADAARTLPSNIAPSLPAAVEASRPVAVPESGTAVGQMAGQSAGQSAEQAAGQSAEQAAGQAPGPAGVARIARPVAAAAEPRPGGGKPLASISLDADNLWSYMKTHGDPAWESRPGYLTALGPRLIDAYGRHGVTASVFVVGHDAATEDGAKFVAELSAAGHEIANHSYEHEPWLHLYSRNQLEDELARTEAAIMDAGAPRPIGFRGPGYSLSPTLLELLEERGYAYDATTLPTWIGPLARAYYFRSAKLSAADREQRKGLFGSAREGLRPVGPYRWRTTARPNGPGLVELPVTTMPLAKVPIHVSYVLHLHQINPRLATNYVSTSLRACRIAGVGPSILLHPLDILDRDDAPGLEFFPGMALRAAEKAKVLDHFLAKLTADFDVVGTAEHARRLGERPLPVHQASDAGMPDS